MAGGVRSSNDNNTIAEINVIPLVDIILVVLIIFMVAAPMVMKPKIDINLPKSTTTATKEKDLSRMKVVLGKKGELFVDNQAVSLEGLTSESRKRALAHADASALLVADKDVTLEMVTSLVDAIKQGGVQKIAFSIQKK